MIKVENWSFSTLDKCKIINETDKTLQCEVQFNRRLINKKVMDQLKEFGFLPIEMEFGHYN